MTQHQESQYSPYVMSRRMLLGGLLAGATSQAAQAERKGDVVLGQDGWIFAGWEDIRFLDQGKLRQVCDLVLQTTTLLRQSKVNIVLTLAPTRARIYADKLPSDFQPAPLVQQRYATVLDLLRKSGALVPDMATPLTQLRRTEAQSLFFKTDSHWTPAATEPLGMMLGKQIKDTFNLPPSNHPGTKLGAIEARTHPGDLLGTLPAADKAKYPATEPFKIRKVLAQPSGDVWSGLLEEDGADVAVVGNSYMLPYFGLTPMLSNTLNRPLSLFWRTARVGPWKTLLEYLASDLYRQQRPKVIIWHLMEGSMEYGPDAMGWWGDSAMPTPKYTAELHRLLGA